jgi:hypothetical protein
MNTNPPGSEITVGIKSADIIGRDERAIQSAIMLARSKNISRVRVLKGIYVCKNSIFLKAGIELTGEGNLTIIRRDTPKFSPLIKSVHHYERIIAVKNPDLFPVGCGIRITGIKRLTQEKISVRATVTAKNGHQLLLDKPYLGENFWLEEGEANVSTLVPLITGENIRDLIVRQLQIDGNIPTRNMVLGGGDGIYLKNCQRAIIRDVYVHNNNGEAVGFEISHDVTVEKCVVEANALAMHAGSGSLRMHVRHNVIKNNMHGFYFCWGIQQGMLENNEIRGNDTYGISIGFHDSHNTIRQNRIINNGEVGILFRGAHHPGQSPCDNLLESNMLENNGPKNEALGIKITAEADDIKIFSNNILEKRRGRKSVGILIEKTVKAVKMDKNVIRGFKKDISDQRRGKKN